MSTVKPVGSRVAAEMAKFRAGLVASKPKLSNYFRAFRSHTFR